MYTSFKRYNPITGWMISLYLVYIYMVKGVILNLKSTEKCFLNTNTL